MVLLSLGVAALQAVGLVAAAAYPRAAKYTSALSDTFIYDLDNVPIAAPVVTSKTGVKVNAKVYLVDGEGHSAAQIANYKSQGKTVICYFSAGSWEPGRKDALDFPAECYCGAGVPRDSTTGRCQGSKANQNKLDDWDEWYLDIHNSACLSKIQELQAARIQTYVDKGCDGIDPDNVDEYLNTQTFGITAQDQVNYLLWLSQTARSKNLAIDLKNGGDLLVRNDKATKWQASLVQAFDFNVIEECHRYNECEIYDSFLAAGKPQIQIEYITDEYTPPNKCPTLKTGQHFLIYNKDSLNTQQITRQCSDSA